MNEAPDYPARGLRDLPLTARRALRRPGADRLGGAEAEGDDVRLGADPRAVPRRSGSLEFALRLAREAKVAVSPGVGFGPGGEGYVRFALVENEQRIGQAVAGLRRALSALG